MKKILLLILLFMPFIAKAELKELELVDQYNTGYSGAYYMGNYMFLIHSVYNGRMYGEPAIAAMDFDGNYIYEKTLEHYENKIAFDGEYFYNVYRVDLGNSRIDMYIEKYNPENGEKIGEIVIEHYDTLMTYYVKNIDGYIGIDNTRGRNDDYIVKKDLSSYEEVETVDTYPYEMYDNHVTYISDEDKMSLMYFLYMKNFDGVDLSDKIVEFNNHYFTFHISDGPGNVNIPVIIYADKELTDYDLIPVKNDNIYDGTKIQTDFFIMQDLIPLEDRLIAILGYSGTCQIAFNPSNRFGDDCNSDFYIQIYKMVYNIVTNTDGNGEIRISKDTANPKDEVSFEIIPKEGYVLSEVKVTDSEGNTITFTDYKFTMPSSNVTIKATFVKEEIKAVNPNTKDIITVSIAVFIVSLLTYIFSITIYKPIKED